MRYILLLTIVLVGCTPKPQVQPTWGEGGTYQEELESVNTPEFIFPSDPRLDK
jgi:hypothetical protein